MADNQQRLMGASLLIFKNKSDVSSSMTEDDIRQVRFLRPPQRFASPRTRKHDAYISNLSDQQTGFTTRLHPHAQVEDHDLQRYDGAKLAGRLAVGCSGRQRPTIPVLNVVRCYED
jgi:hypothetical protein